MWGKLVSSTKSFGLVETTVEQGKRKGSLEVWGTSNDASRDIGKGWKILEQSLQGVVK